MRKIFLILSLFIFSCDEESDWTCSIYIDTNNMSNIISSFGENGWQSVKEHNYIEYGDSLIYKQTTVQARDSSEAEETCCELNPNPQTSSEVCNPMNNPTNLSLYCSCE